MTMGAKASSRVATLRLAPLWLLVAGFGPAQLAQAQAVPDSLFPQSAEPLGDNTLDGERAKQNIVATAIADQQSQVNGNSVGSNVTTGTVAISDNALGNANGLVLVTANSGNNVSINAALTVNLVITPGN